MAIYGFPAPGAMAARRRRRRVPDVDGFLRRVRRLLGVPECDGNGEGTTASPEARCPPAMADNTQRHSRAPRTPRS